MGMTLHELQTRMSSREFSMHQALAALDRDAASQRTGNQPTVEEMEWFGNAE